MKVLMHICCGPCAVYPTEVLQQEGHEIKGLFYNPNIHPIDEYERRRENAGILAREKGFDIEYIDDFRQKQWEDFSGQELSRCTMCYALRMDKAASVAAKGGFDAFTTSLLVSPYQKHELIRELAESYGNKYGVKFLYRDFRPGFRQGQQGAKDLGLYRQKFCGCIVSFNERNIRQASSKQR